MKRLYMNKSITKATITVEANKSGIFICPFCSSRLRGFASFQSHLSRQHPSEPKPNKRNIEQFSFEDRCSNVLQVTNETKNQKCGGLATYRVLLPNKLVIKQQMSCATLVLLSFLHSVDFPTLSKDDLRTT
ncbi:hypothetical protein BDF21DRAFT_395205 [Thamnidium elegans]|nr:hypothetical protein BDF21DRAFT_395205 [Thamnidium elegans]